MDIDERTEIALWRVAVLGALISTELEHGELRAHLEHIGARVHTRPDGRRVTLSPRTIEGWHYAYRRGGLEALKPKRRRDRGQSRAIRSEVAALILRAKREKPRRSVRRIIRMLERARVVRRGELSRSSVHRLLAAHGISRQPPRGPSGERRSFLPAHAGDLWMGDAMHGPRVVAPDGRLRKSYMLSQLDAATRFLAHSFFAVSEGAVDHEHGLKQALLKHGRPRIYYVDRGAAYMAHSLRLICAELGITLLHTKPRDCEAKGGIERFHRRWREEVGDELPDAPLKLDELNAIHWAWQARDYHAVEHTTTERAPLAHWLAEAEHLRALPRNKKLDDVFLHRARRKVRKDGTVRFKGGFYEVRPELVGQTIELRFDPTATTLRPRAFVDDAFVCDAVPLDRLSNTTRRRRRDLGAPEPDVEPTGIDPLAQILDEHYRRTRPIEED